MSKNSPDFWKTRGYKLYETKPARAKPVGPSYTQVDVEAVRKRYDKVRAPKLAWRLHPGARLHVRRDNPRIPISVGMVCRVIDGRVFTQWWRERPGVWVEASRIFSTDGPLPENLHFGWPREYVLAQGGVVHIQAGGQYTDGRGSIAHILWVRNNKCGIRFERANLRPGHYTLPLETVRTDIASGKIWRPVVEKSSTS